MKLDGMVQNPVKLGKNPFEPAGHRRGSHGNSVIAEKLGNSSRSWLCGERGRNSVGAASLSDDLPPSSQFLLLLFFLHFYTFHLLVLSSSLGPNFTFSFLFGRGRTPLNLMVGCHDFVVVVIYFFGGFLFFFSSPSPILFIVPLVPPHLDSLWPFFRRHFFLGGGGKPQISLRFHFDPHSMPMSFFRTPVSASLYWRFFFKKTNTTFTDLLFFFWWTLSRPLRSPTCFFFIFYGGPPPPPPASLHHQFSFRSS